MRKLGILLLIVPGLLLGTCQRQSENQAAISPGIIDSVASADGVMIHYKSYGENERGVVFVHGWSCDGSYWARQIESFKDEYQVVTIDLAGHGNSGTNREEWTMGRFGDDVEAVVNNLGLKQVILVGHSMGGAVCIEAARRLPEQTVALIGVDTYQSLSEPPQEQRAQSLMEPFEADFAGAMKEFVTNIFGANADSALVAQVAEDMSQADPDIALACFNGLFSYDAPAALAEMRKPIRTINCELWPTDVEGNRKVAESFEVVLIGSVGHFPQLEVPGVFNVRLREALHEFWPAN